MFKESVTARHIDAPVIVMQTTFNAGRMRSGKKAHRKRLVLDWTAHL